ncbi:MAG: hypothetical protein IJH47_03450 [Oscillospiraceae bacterium]|nr:hypothetical protein [Oscillospiraceae bacterium]
MLKVLVKKQLAEVFKSYFYDAKKNKMRSKAAIAGWIIFFVVIMVGFLGGMFTALSLSMCGGLTDAGMGWLYFALMGGIAILLGAFGSVLNTFSGLYLAKDNDLLLSMPIPVRTIVTARLVNVYLMGTMYAATVLIPVLIVYWIVAGVTAARVICGLLLFLVVTFIVLILSCLLGWVVARISLKLKNKSFITVLLALVFIALYYFVYFKANDLIKSIIQNADVYGTKIKGAAYGVYLFGRIGEGDWLAAAVFTAATGLIFWVIWRLLSRSFLSVATASGSSAKVRYTEKRAREKTPFGALLGKEFARFAASPNYMLNCGLGVLLLPACGVLLLLKGRMVFETIDGVFSGRPGSAAVILCAALFLAVSMNDMAAPSVSLEGKSLWIPQSLPVAPKTALRAKAAVELILSGLPMLFASVCTAAIVDASLPVRLMLCVTPLVGAVFSALFDTFLSVRMPLLSWTSEIAPIKQSGAVAVSLFGSMAAGVLLAGLYLLVGYRIGPALYLLIWTVLLGAGALLLLRWLDTRGAAIFAAL